MMNHHLKSVLLIIAVIGVNVFIALLLLQSFPGKNVLGGIKNSLQAGSITGAAVVGSETAVPKIGCQGRACSVACHSNNDCDDAIPATEDICRNPGTEFSLCVNKPTR